MKAENRHSRLVMSVLYLLFILILSGCGSSIDPKRYEVLLSLGEGMKYRSFIFETIKPTRNPYPEKVNDKFAYSRNKQAAHVEFCTDPVFDEAKPFTQELGAVKVDGKWGYIRLTSREKGDFEYAIQPKYESAEPFNEGLAAVKLCGKYGYIDLAGETVIEPAFISAHYFANGLAAVKSSKGWCFIDTKGDSVIKGPYECAESFTVIDSKNKRALAPVKADGKWGYIDTNGRVSIDFIFDDAWSFSYDSRAAVKKDGRWFYINDRGEAL